MKKKHEQETEQKVSKLKVIKEFFYLNPIIKDLIKLGFYFILIFVIIGVVATSPTPSDISEKNEPKQEEVVEKKYHEILKEVISEEKKYNYEVNFNEQKYIINYSISDKTLTGILETSLNVLKKFVIRENQIYEVALNNETLNMDLFQELNINYINIYSLVELLSKNKSLKMLEDNKTIYTYNLEGEINIKVSVVDENINLIEISEYNSNYEITIN